MKDATQAAPPVALVTGGARRIGAAIVRELHASGFTVALHYRGSEGAAQALAQELCRERPGSCRALRADLSSLPALRELAAEAGNFARGRLDVLVNNASGFEPTPIESCSEDAFDAMLQSNLKAPYFLIQSLLPALRATNGNIVNLLDTHVQRPLPDYNAYVSAKAGLAALTRSLAVELGPQVRVNGVAPGAILWPESGQAYSDSEQAGTVQATPMKRRGDPQDIARTVRFLACEAPFITGQVISVDGGRQLTG